jgi:hypothetical protein
LSTERGRGGFAEAWRLFGVLMQRIGRVQARVMLAVVYVVVIPPLAVFVRVAVDPLRARRRHAGRSGWVDLPAAPPGPAELRRQF